MAEKSESVNVKLSIFGEACSKKPTGSCPSQSQLPGELARASKLARANSKLQSTHQGLQYMPPCPPEVPGSPSLLSALFLECDYISNLEINVVLSLWNSGFPHPYNSVLAKLLHLSEHNQHLSRHWSQKSRANLLLSPRVPLSPPFSPAGPTFQTDLR